MAAEPLAPAMGLSDLRFLRSRAFSELLEEEIRDWRERFCWDFTPSANLVRRFIDQRSLAGYALVEGSEVTGYAYCVTDEPKGLIGDLYVRASHRTPQTENRLLAAAVDLLLRVPGVSRIETQLMLMESKPGAWLPGARYLRQYERQFLVIDLDRTAALAPRRDAQPCVHPWQDRFQEPAAVVVAEAYRGHIDGAINDQYRSLAGARRFLFNIIQYPGCGSFCPQASFVAMDPATGALRGVSLAGSVGRDAGHVTQVCVTPAARGQGLGYELLRQSLAALRRMGYARCSLTVTTVNQHAVALYERMGFRAACRFPALVWEGFA